MKGEFCNPSLYQTMCVTFHLTISAAYLAELFFGTKSGFGSHVTTGMFS